ncbi:MAG: SUMF1/EgtB/PvdO family nonheme iron enzyme [Bradyrhizobiaceae bacterium]|nr:SUMF1/EgtB/PvdO family nonheme iron enzyme [Bradyrhizobiaceae bacterium]
MNHRLITPFLAAFVITITVIGCSDSEPLPPNGTGLTTVSGTITMEGTTQGVSGVSMSMGARMVSSDAKGRFSFDSVSAGNYVVTPSLTGRTFSPESRQVTVADASVTDVDFQLVDRSATDSIYMVLLPAGTYMRGADSAYKDMMEVSVPKHSVTLTRSFWIGIHEVTQEQWQRVMDVDNSVFKGPTMPVTNVTWEQALEFCNAMSDLHGYQRVYSNIGQSPVIDWNANGYRLPTEAEWEYAAAAGDTTMFYGVPDLGPHPTVEERQAFAQTLADYGWFNVNSAVDGVIQTHPVGQLKSNAYGLFDMMGNATEWTNDSEGLYSIQPLIDPCNRSSNIFRMSRGGHVGHGPGAGLSTRFRAAYSYTAADPSTGLRIVRIQ